MRRALVDSGAIFAFIVRNDEHHTEAVDFMKRWLNKSGTFVLADVVFFEAMTLLKARAGAKVAIRSGRELRRNPAYKWMTLTPELEHETWATFEKYGDKNWSYTDCALLIYSKHFKIADVFSFDEDFRQMTGIRRVP